MLVHSGLRVAEDFIIRNVSIDDSGNYIRTIEAGMSNPEVMVLIHGYGGSGIMFWKIMKPLAEKYHLVMIDIIGMGGSSRPNFAVKDQSEADDFLVMWLEAWRQKFVPGGLTGFILAGHSFGGYVAGLYACRYHSHIKKLLMLSPVGVTTRGPDFNLDAHIERRMRKVRRPPPRCCFKCIMCTANKIWGCHCSPFKIMRCCGRCCVAPLMKNYIRRRFESVP